MLGKTNLGMTFIEAFGLQQKIYKFLKKMTKVMKNHEKDSFNIHFRNYMYYSAEVGSRVKNQVLEVL